MKPIKKSNIIIMVLTLVTGGALTNCEKPHVHNFGSEWLYNETEHYHECGECHEKQDIEAHSLTSPVITKEPSSLEPGEKESKCSVCDYSESEDYYILPGEVTSLVASSSSQSVTLSWEAPLHQGGFEEVSYEVKLSEDDWINVNTNLTYTFEGLENGTEYEFHVRAYNELGVGISKSIKQIPLNTPSKPQSLTYTINNGMITLEWNAPLDNGGSPITHYEFRIDDEEAINVGLVTSYAHPDRITGGVNHTVGIKAINKAGGGEEETALVFYYAPPLAVANLRFDRYLNSITVLWDPPLNANETNIKEYQIRLNSTQWKSTNETSYKIQWVEPGEIVFVEVRAVGAGLLGYGPISDQSVTTIFLPSPPTITSSSSTEEGLLVNWVAGESDGDSPLLRYEVAIDDEDWIDVGLVTEYSSGPIGGGVDHTFKVRAVNKAGDSVAANVTLPTYYSLPGLVQNLRAEGSIKRIRLDWEPPANANEAQITGYQYQLEGETNWVSTTSNNVTRAILQDDTTYTLHVRAVGIKGYGPIASISSITHGLPGSPENLRVLFDENNYATMNWDAPLDWGRDNVMYYEVRIIPEGVLADTVGWISVNRDLTYTEENSHDFRQSCTFQVRSRNNVGYGGITEYVVPGYEDALEVQNLTRIQGTDSITIAWNEPINALQAGVYAYVIEISDGRIVTVDRNVTSAKFFDFEKDVNYSFEVSAVGKTGKGIISTISASLI